MARAHDDTGELAGTTPRGRDGTGPRVPADEGTRQPGGAPPPDPVLPDPVPLGPVPPDPVLPDPVPLGPVPPDPVLREAEPRDEPALLALFEACEDWFVAATGLPAAPGDVQSLYYALPEGADPGEKRILVAEVDGVIVGLVDVVLRHPLPDSAAVGLFLLSPGARGQGLGTRLADVLLRRAAADGIRRVTATVPAGWRAGEAFLTSLGCTFTATAAVQGEVDNRRAGPREAAVRRAALHLQDR